MEFVAHNAEHPLQALIERRPPIIDGGVAPALTPLLAQKSTKAVGKKALKFYSSMIIRVIYNCSA